MNLFYKTTRFFVPFCLLFGFAFAQDAGDGPIVSVMSAVTDDDQGDFTELYEASNVTTVVIGGKTYALVTGYGDHGVQIMDITNPISPTATATVMDETGGFTELANARGIATVAIEGKTYALVTGYDDDGVQIINISDPASPTATAAVKDGEDGFTELDGPAGITTVVIDDKTYALVAAYEDDGVEIINITDPASPSPTASVSDGSIGFSALDGAVGITTVVIGGKTYALVSSYGDHAVQIIDISDPASPTAMAAVTDDNSGEFTALAGARGITMTEINGNTYALVASYIDDAVQIMGINSSGDTLGTGGSEALQALALYPNPVTHTLHIQSPLASELSYRIYDLTGKALSTHHQSGQSHSIDVSGLAKGIYFLKATHKNNTTALQFVKQ